jgi:peptide-methionine (S)-S-oxide reductase
VAIRKINMKHRSAGFAALFLLTLVLPTPIAMHASDESPLTQTATFGAGCFWCVEAVLQTLPGVRSVSSGYMGGTVENPSYRQVSGGSTGHAEVVQVTFDPAQLAYEELLSWFWRLHDPTTLNRQGADVGTMYRSVIFYHDEVQRQAAQDSMKAVQLHFKDAIVTEIVPAAAFYAAEQEHQDFYSRNRNYPYCRVVIRPKLEKLGLSR